MGIEQLIDKYNGVLDIAETAIHHWEKTRSEQREKHDRIGTKYSDSQINIWKARQAIILQVIADLESL